MRIRNKGLAALMIALLLGAAARAEVYEGTTAAARTVPIIAKSGGTVSSLGAEAGDRVEAGDVVADTAPQRVFAVQDGSVSIVHAEAGATADGAVLEVMPTERYRVWCTVEGAYQSAESTLVHSGETVHLRCTQDGSHRAVGIVTEIDGATYQVLTLGGALYVGETVNLYRDADYTASGRVGIGTVVSNDTLLYEASGDITRLCVETGDPVERGQLLFEVGGETVSCPEAGILSAVEVQPGQSVESGQAVAELVPLDAICAEIKVDETAAAHLTPGLPALIVPAGYDEEAAIEGVVLAGAWTAEDGLYTVRVAPLSPAGLPLGLSVSVRVDFKTLAIG